MKHWAALIRLVLGVILAATGGLAQWKRYVHDTGEGGETERDSPPSHDLAYFQRDPCSRSDKSDRPIQCADAFAQGSRANVQAVGKIGEYTVYDVEYLPTGCEKCASIRSTLVEARPNQVHEIQLQETWGGTFVPTEIIRAGQQEIIRAKFDDVGMFHVVYEDYFVILKGVAILLDFKPVFRAAAQVAPKGSGIYQPTEDFDFGALVFHARTVLVDPDVSPRMQEPKGRVEVPFSVNDGRVIAGKARYFPEQ